ncbi:MAG: hypothetical protein RL753_867, partial [Bacteroidota bacterium]
VTTTATTATNQNTAFERTILKSTKKARISAGF